MTNPRPRRTAAPVQALAIRASKPSKAQAPSIRFAKAYLRFCSHFGTSKRDYHGHFPKGVSGNRRGGPSNAQIRVKAAFIERQNEFILRTGKRPLTVNQATAEGLREQLDPLISDLVNAQIARAFDPEVDAAVRRHVLNDLVERTSVGPVPRAANVAITNKMDFGAMHIEALRELSRKNKESRPALSATGNSMRVIEHQPWPMMAKATPLRRPSPQPWSRRC